jgi:hypothetical protein
MDRPIIDDTLHRRLSAARLAEAELRRLTLRLDNPELCVEQLKLLNGSGVDRLLARRAELLGAVQRSRPRLPTPIPLLDSRGVLGELLNSLWPWRRIAFSSPADGVNVTPGVPGTDGSIGAEFYQGELAFGGMLSDAGTTEPGVEKYWLHDCQCGVQFPAVNFESTLQFRFAAGTEVHIYLDPVLSGSVMCYATLGTTPDVNVPITNWEQNSQFLLNASLPGELNLYGGTTFSGSIEVTAGHSAALGLVLGAIVGAANGYVQLLWGIVDTGVVGASKPGDYGQLEYRVIPVLVNKALQNFVEQYFATNQS